MDVIWGWICDMFNNIINAVLMFLPDSPFATFEFPPEVQQLLGYVNYFVPFQAMVNIALAWTAAIGIYYIYQSLLRWARAIR
ncbi:MAG: hypothetical protein E7485_09265 [Ruminococcaceae bacterium]|nr:hypothetical protein [Oscillospiraceae bacterium]